MTNELKEILDTPIFIIDNEGFTVYINDKINDYITNLQEENEKLKDSLETMTFTAKIKQEAIDSLIKKIDKAIEYCDREIGIIIANFEYIDTADLENVRKILQGEDKE